MQTILILFATREGHTQRIADRLSTAIHKLGHSADVVDAADPPDRLNLDLYSGVIVAASVHAGKHESEIIEFVKRHRQELERRPAVFLSVSLSEAGVEDEDAPPERRAKAAADVDGMIHAFLEETGWAPAKIQAVAGALLYTKYNFLIKMIMRRIAQASGGSTDTSKDHDYTNWALLDRLVEELVGKSSM